MTPINQAATSPIKTDNQNNQQPLKSSRIGSIGTFIKNIGSSAICGYVGTKLFAELPVNIASKALNIVGLAEREGWIYFNAPGMAVFGAGTALVFSATNKIFDEAKNPDGTTKSVSLGLDDVNRMAKAGRDTYLVLKGLEVLGNGLLKFGHMFKTAHYDSLQLHGGIGVAGAVLLGKGISDLDDDSDERSNKSKVKLNAGEIPIVIREATAKKPTSKLAIAEIVAGGVGLGYTILGTFIKYPSAAPLPPITEYLPVAAPSSWMEYISYTFGMESSWRLKAALYGIGLTSTWDAVKEVKRSQDWSWTYFGAEGWASRAAIIPVQILSRQIFGKLLLSNEEVPEVVRKGAEIVATTGTAIGSVAVASYLGLPGVTLGDPYEMFKSTALWMGGMYALEKGVTFIVDRFFGDEDTEHQRKVSANKLEKMSPVSSAPPKKLMTYRGPTSKPRSAMTL